MFCRPANSNIDPQIKYHNRHIDDIEHQRHQFQNKRSTSIACPRNRLKIDIPRDYKNIGGTKDKQRRKRCRNKIGHIGVNAQNPIGTKDKEYSFYKELCDEKEVTMLYVEAGDHLLEIQEKPFDSIKVLEDVMRFINAEIQ